MGKRGAVAATTSPKAKVVRSAKADATPDPLAPVIAFLDEAGLPGACRKMLQAAAPFALNTPKEQRHEHQTSVVEELAELYAQAEQRHGADLSSAKAAAVEHAEASEAAKVALEATTLRVAKLAEEKQAKNTAYETATDGVKKAKEKLQTEQEKAASIASGKAIVESKRSEFDQVMRGDFEKLKNSEFPNKDWRARNKTIARVLEHLGHAGPCQALLDALPAALKTAAADRGKFAAATVEHAEAAARDYVEKMAAEIRACDGPAAEQAREVACAEQAVAAAELVEKAAWQAVVDAENAWAEEQGQKDDETATVNSAAPKSKALAEMVEEASRALERLSDLRAQFDALAKQAVPQPEVTDASPAPEAPTEVAELQPVLAA